MEIIRNKYESCGCILPAVDQVNSFIFNIRPQSNFILVHNVSSFHVIYCPYLENYNNPWLVKWLTTPSNMAQQHPGIWVFHPRGLNQWKIVVCFKQGIKRHIVTLHWHILHNINVIKFMLNISVLSNEKCPTYQWRILNEMNQWKDYLFYQNILKLSISKLSFYSVMKFTFFSKTAMRIVNGNKMLMSSWQLLCFVHFDYHLISYMCF